MLLIIIFFYNYVSFFKWIIVLPSQIKNITFWKFQPRKPPKNKSKIHCWHILHSVEMKTSQIFSFRWNKIALLTHVSLCENERSSSNFFCLVERIWVIISKKYGLSGKQSTLLIHFPQIGEMKYITSSWWI